MYHSDDVYSSPWPGIIKLVPAWESLVSDIPAGDGKTANLFCSVERRGSGVAGYCGMGKGEKLWSGETKRL